MFCPECGYEILDDSSFCSECGTPLEIEEEQSFETEDTAYVEPVVNVDEEKKESSGKKRTIVFVVIGVIGILLLLAAALVLLKKLGTTDEKKNQDVDKQAVTEETDEIQTNSDELSEIIINTEKPEETVVADDILVTEEVEDPFVEESYEEIVKEETMKEDIGYDTQPFYGIWCASSKDEGEMWAYVEDLRAQGFDAMMVSTNDWSNLNDGWYSVTAGMYYSEEDAMADLEWVQNVCADAYVKYAGEFN